MMSEEAKKNIEALEHDSEEHREAFEHELEELAERVKKIATTAVVVGGSFALSYYVIKKLVGGSKSKSKKLKNGKVKEVVIQKRPSVFSSVGNVILTEIAVFLLAIAKEKLIEYLDNLNSPEDEHSQNA